ncbi:MAG TPA: MoaD/ThiS family protein [Silvibacterium sp.]|nr:MoaD/ThiS family protein [Silvibacterium sp.]
MSLVRVEIPFHLRNLAGAGREITLDVAGVVSVQSVLDALEARYPMLKGTIRDQKTRERRPFLRFFACEEDWSHESPEKALPDEVVFGKEPLLIIGAIAGGNFALSDTGFAPSWRWRVGPPFGREIESINEEGGKEQCS